MARTLNVYGKSLGQAYDLFPGDTHYWVLWGSPAENGVVAWISVKPFPGGHDYPGEKILEVSRFSHEATPDGGRRIFFDVTNVGVNPILAYAIYCGWTDAI